MEKVVLEELKKLIIKNTENNQLTYDSFFDIVNNVSEKYELGEEFLDKAFFVIKELNIELDTFAKDDTSFSLDVDVDGYSRDIVVTYFKTISKFPLLTEGEELNMLIDIENAKDEKEEKALKEKFLKHNLKLVISVAKRYSNSCNASIDFIDLIQEGNMGLSKAIDKFDYKLGYKFSTYAVWWIRQAIVRYISDVARTVRVPVHAHDKARKLYKIMAKFINNNQEVSNEELASLTGWTVDQVKQYKTIIDDPVSLNSPVNEEDDDEIGVFIADNSSSVYENLEKEALKGSLDLALSILKPREKRVIEYRFGLFDGKSYTLEEIAKLPDYNLTRERVRQIELNALKKIRKNPNIIKELSVYLESDSNVRAGFLR